MSDNNIESKIQSEKIITTKTIPNIDFSKKLKN